jgi:hypothetical protein
MLQTSNNIKACQILQYHILNMEVFEEVLLLLVEVPHPMEKRHTIWLDDEDSPSPKWFKQNLDCD